MSPTPDDLLGRWLHSHEEDGPDFEAYRPADHDFPPSRGRKGMEFESDGTYREIRIGPTDRMEEHVGRWSLQGTSELHLKLDAEGFPEREVEILECSPSLLRIRR